MNEQDELQQQRFGWLKKFRDSIVVTKHTKLFVLASILQLCTVVALEGRVFYRNNTFRIKLVQIFEIEKWSSDLASACKNNPENISKSFSSYDVPLV
ncbi:6255_t:CDS:2, partial [Acaulospora colombiana]